jgi:hypothetical protein
MATYTVQDFLTEQAPVISDDINQKLMEQPTPWITLYRQSFWDDEKSSTQKTMQFDRAMIAGDADEVEWADVAQDIVPSDSTANHQAGTGDGIPPSDNIEFGQTLREYNLQHKAIWGPPMNTNQLRDKFSRVKQMGACVKALADQARENWIERKRREYTRIASQLVVLNSGFNLNTDRYNSLAFPVATGTDHTDASILTNGFTDSLYEYLNLHGAGRGAMGMVENRPVYGLVTSSRQSRRLVMADPEIREDFRYSSQNEKLLAPMGVKWSYNGFTHIIDDKTNRFEYFNSTAQFSITGPVGNADGILVFTSSIAAALDALPNKPTRLYKGTQITVNTANPLVSGPSYIVTGIASPTGSTGSTPSYYVRLANGAPVTTTTATTLSFKAWIAIPQYIVVDSGLSRKKVPNPGWLNATWEDSYVFHQDVCTSLVPKPITSVGPAQFDAVNYSGTFSWKNYEDRENNPDGTIGQFRGVLSNGTRPDNPEFGIVIRHLAVAAPAGRVMNEGSLG